MFLAIETSTDQASVALGRPGAIIAEETLPGVRQHARGLLPLIQEVLRGQGVELADLQGVLVADGPGSFTGLRIGAAVAKALVHTRRTPSVATSMLPYIGSPAAASRLTFHLGCSAPRNWWRTCRDPKSWSGTFAPSFWFPSMRGSTEGHWFSLTPDPRPALFCNC
jgi:tRNA threonylcarbamoyl adenosine modification protein YeaZ